MYLKYHYCNQTFKKKIGGVDNFFAVHKKYFKKNKKVILSVRKKVLPLQSKFCKYKFRVKLLKINRLYANDTAISKKRQICCSR